MDVGNPWDMLDANLTLLSATPSDIRGTVEEGVCIQGTVIVGEGSVVKSGTYIEGPCIIGKNCRIGPHAYIRGATSINDDCHIGHCSELKNSIIMNGTKIPHFNYIGDSIIGSECNFGAGTKIANLRHDHANVRVCGKDTQRKKFGADYRRWGPVRDQLLHQCRDSDRKQCTVCTQFIYRRVHWGKCNYPLGEKMQAVILAAGEGKRVRPLTRSRPKALTPVANRPIIEYVIEALLKNGIRDIIVVVGYRKEQVTRFLNELDVPIAVVVQEQTVWVLLMHSSVQNHILPGIFSSFQEIIILILIRSGE